MESHRLEFLYLALLRISGDKGGLEAEAEKNLCKMKIKTLSGAVFGTMRRLFILAEVAWPLFLLLKMVRQMSFFKGTKHPSVC